jgi:hypothetical protein
MHHDVVGHRWEPPLARLKSWQPGADLEASTAVRRADVAAAKTTIEGTDERFDLSDVAFSLLRRTARRSGRIVDAGHGISVERH